MRRLLLLSVVLSAASAEAAHPVFDLIANRTLAHVQRGGGLAILAGSPGFARYLHFSRPLPTWKLRLIEDGRKVALAQTQAVLEVPLTAAQAHKSTLWLRLKSPSKQSVRATTRGQASTAVALAEGWQTVSITLPAGALVEGENKIVLGFAQSGTLAGLRASAAVEWIQIGGEPPPAEAAPSAPTADGLTLPKDGGVAYYVQIPTGGSLAANGEAGGCVLMVRARTAERKPLEATLNLGVPLDLSAIAGRVARLEIGAEGPGCSQAKLTRALLTAVGDSPQVRYPSKARNAIIWLTDSTRADKFKIYNPKTRVETPVMDAFARRSTVFKVGYVQGNESRVSHASLFSGMYPATHKFIPEKAKLNAAFVTLPEVAKPLGLRTAGFMGNGFIRASWGFGDGWDSLKNHIQDSLGLKGEDLRKAAQGWLAGAHTQPFFLYIGTIDAHVSWKAHSPWIEKYDPEPYSGKYTRMLSDPELDLVVAGKVVLSDRDKVRVRALYDSDVSYNDQQFGELLKYLEKTGHADDTLIILVADHGEEFWEHGKVGHGQSLREELVHIPFVVHYPPLFPAGKVVEEGVEVIDVLPTLADALGGKPPMEAQGETLVPLAQGEGSGYPRPAIASQYELAHTMRLGRWKLWIGGSGDLKLFDAADDPLEVRELAASRPIERRFVTDALGVWMAYQTKWKKTRWGVASNHKPQLAADLEEAVK